MTSQEENSVILMDFLEKGESLVLVIYVNQQGQLTPINDFPATSKNKVQIDAVLAVTWVFWSLGSAADMMLYL